MKRDRKIHVHFIVPMPLYTQSTRFRVKQYLPYLEANGVECTVSSFVFPAFERIIYRPGKTLLKAFYFLLALGNRVLDIFRVIRADVVFIHREACPYGPDFFEWIYQKVNGRSIYDFDDAIHIPQPSTFNRLFDILKNPEKVNRIIRRSKRVICAIPYLEEHVRRFNAQTEIIWTPVHDEAYQVRTGTRGEEAPVVVGWIGSHSTQVHPKAISNVYSRIAGKYSDVAFKFVDAEDLRAEGARIICKPFNVEEEIEDLQSFDIGIYPLRDDPFTRGKCGFKCQQYMAVGIPTVSSPVGGVTDFVEEGRNGFFARNEDEWVEKLSRLIEDPELRRRIGMEGRKTVEMGLSVRANAPKLLRVIREVAGQKGRDEGAAL